MIKIGSSKIVLLTIFALMVLISYPVNTQANQDPLCPAGYVCTPISVPSVPVACPAGFTCVPTVVNNSNSLILSPKEGEMYNIGDQVLIKWYEKNVSDAENYNLILKNSKTGIRKTIADSVLVRSSGIDGTSSFLWTVPQVESNGNYQIEIYRPEAREATMWSGNFAIKSTNSLNPSPSPLSSPAVLSCSPIATNLKIGDISNDVSLLHDFLIAKGYSFPSINSGANPKNYFGMETLGAVMKYQKSIGVYDTGFVGPMTRGVINASCNNNSGSKIADIKVLSPNGGESLIKGTTAKIEWNYSPLPPSNFAINLQRADRMENVGQIRFCDSSTYYQDNYPNANHFWFNWRVGYDAQGKEIPDGNYRVMVYNCGDVRDVSDSSFTISSQSLTNPNCPAGFICPSSTPSPSPTITPASLMVSINSPRQGDTWSVGETKTISWNYNNFDSTIYGNKYVDVLLVPSDGREPVKLGTNISAPANSLPVRIYEKTSDGRSAWLSGNYKIRVVCQTTNAARFNSCYGESGSFKVISPSPSPSATVGATVR